MNANMGRIDRALRLLIGLAIAGAGIGFQSWWGLVALIPLATAAIGWCPLYRLFGLSTCPAR